MDELKGLTLCVLGCGNLGIAILKGLLSDAESLDGGLPIARYIACVRSERSEERLRRELQTNLDRVGIIRGDNQRSVSESDVVILGVDPADIEAVLTDPGIREALAGKLLISIAAGWTSTQLETTLYGSESVSTETSSRAIVVRVLPNIAALVSQSLTAIEISEPKIPEHFIQLTDAIFRRVGRTVQIPPRLMDATTALAGSTPAFFSVICDALIDAAVAVGVPRDLAHTMTFQSMQGTAALLQSGIHPAILKDQGTSPEGCTIGGLMVLEERGVRGTVGRALRESVTIARQMGTNPHVNDTRQ